MIPSSDIAFTPAVKAVQSARGSRELYARMEARGGFRTQIDERLIGVLARANSAYLVTASADGQPYAQHRGGARGFIQVLGDGALGFADLAGNGQYVTTGNLAENPKAFLFLMDYARQARIKLWGRARVVEDDPDLLLRLAPPGESAEAVILFELAAWDINCPRHIPQKFDADQVAQALAERDAEIARLRAEVETFRALAGDRA